MVVVEENPDIALIKCIPESHVIILPVRLFKDGASFCYCTYILRISGYSSFYGNCPLIQKYFCVVYDYMEKADLSKGYQNPKRKLGVTTHFSEIIELKFRKKLPYILCILALFWNYGCLINSEKCVVTDIFLFGFQSPLLRSTFFPQS